MGENNFVEWKELAGEDLKSYKNTLFTPTSQICDLDFSKGLGSLDFRMSLAHGSTQFAHTSFPQTSIYISGLMSKVVAPKDSVLKLAVESAEFKGNDFSKSSYKDFFDENYKNLMIKKWTNREIDPSGKANVVIKLENGVEFKTFFDAEYPSEWYSSFYANRSFAQNLEFYDTETIAKDTLFTNNKEDLKGCRISPVLAFSLEVPLETIQKVLNTVYSYSKPILLKDKVLFGIKCKYFEYNEPINQTYLAGGKIVKNQEWNWD